MSCTDDHSEVIASAREELAKAWDEGYYRSAVDDVMTREFGTKFRSANPYR